MRDGGFMLMKKKSTALFLFAVISFSFQAFAYRWVESPEGYDCKIACTEAGLKTHYTDNVNDSIKKFYVCMANIKNEGYRAGHSTSHKPGCKIAYDEKVITAMSFYCMCG